VFATTAGPAGRQAAFQWFATLKKELDMHCPALLFVGHADECASAVLQGVVPLVRPPFRVAASHPERALGRGRPQRQYMQPPVHIFRATIDATRAWKFRSTTGGDTAASKPESVCRGLIVARGGAAQTVPFTPADVTAALQAVGTATVQQV
jgi:hypothetical protein